MKAIDILKEWKLSGDSDFNVELKTVMEYFIRIGLIFGIILGFGLGIILGLNVN